MYAWQWSEREGEDLETLSEWVKAVRSIKQIRIHKLGRSMNTNAKSVFIDPSVARQLCKLHDIYVVVAANKAPYNIVFVCKSHYTCLIKELGVGN